MGTDGQAPSQFPNLPKFSVPTGASCDFETTSIEFCSGGRIRVRLRFDGQERMPIVPENQPLIEHTFPAYSAGCRLARRRPKSWATLVVRCQDLIFRQEVNSMPDLSVLSRSELMLLMSRLEAGMLTKCEELRCPSGSCCWQSVWQFVIILRYCTASSHTATISLQTLCPS